MRCLVALVCALIVLTSSCVAQTYEDYRARLIIDEGYKTVPYRDGRQFTVGIGHLIVRPRPVYAPSDIEAFFRQDLAAALSTARSSIVGFDTLPIPAKLSTVSMIFTLGRAGFYRFPRFRSAMSQRDYLAAAHELDNTPWIAQTGERGQRIKDEIFALSRLTLTSSSPDSSLHP